MTNRNVRSGMSDKSQSEPVPTAAPHSRWPDRPLRYRNHRILPVPRRIIRTGRTRKQKKTRWRRMHPGVLGRYPLIYHRLFPTLPPAGPGDDRAKKQRKNKSFPSIKIRSGINHSKIAYIQAGFEEQYTLNNMVVTFLQMTVNIFSNWCAS